MTAPQPQGARAGAVREAGVRELRGRLRWRSAELWLQGFRGEAGESSLTELSLASASLVLPVLCIGQTHLEVSVVHAHQPPV